MVPSATGWLLLVDEESESSGKVATNEAFREKIARSRLWPARIGSRIACWRRSLAGKITLVFLGGVLVAYGLGALVGGILFVSASNEQWEMRARLNTQIAIATLRRIYTSVSVGVDRNGQIDRVITPEPIGDDASVLATGFNPIDVLALVSAQTSNAVWLFRFDKGENAFVNVAVAYDQGTGSDTPSVVREPLFTAEAKDAHLKTGFAMLGGVQHFVGLLPVMTTHGEIIGAIAASIGPASELYRAQHTLLRSSLLMLLAVMGLTGITITIIAGQLLKSVPALVQATLRIAREETDVVTPFQNRTDEIGDMASAIETLREAMAERARLREIRDTALQMEHMAHHDSLTGLPNRALLIKTLDKVLAACEAGDAVYNVMLLDLDRFKAVNDTLGHTRGDALLVAFADRLTIVLGSDDIAARLGGDEFAILQRVTSDANKEGGRLAERILEAASATFVIAGNHVRVGASIGIATAPAHGTATSTVLHCADVGLYRAKAAGRGVAAFFQPGMDMDFDGRGGLEADLQLALQLDQFELHYQPIVNLRSGQITAVEALVRWRHPTRGLMAPDLFIPLAEETGLIVPLGAWVLRRACRDAAGFPDHIDVSVNLSPFQLLDAAIIRTVTEALADSGLAPGRLELEVTETAALTGTESIVALEKIAAIGVRIGLDDFGTGYASLSSIIHVHFNKIKIDRKFVAGLTEDRTCQAIVGALIALARGAGMGVTAEGVETADQAVMLKAAGCLNAQGYYFGRPQQLADLKLQRPSGDSVHGNTAIRA